jgi:hypothetical protein
MQRRAQKLFFAQFQKGSTNSITDSIEKVRRGELTATTVLVSLNTLLTITNLLVVKSGAKPHLTGEVIRNQNSLFEIVVTDV